MLGYNAASELTLNVQSVPFANKPVYIFRKTIAIVTKKNMYDLNV